MAEVLKDLGGHLLTELGRIHTSHDRIFDKLSEQGETLVRNTVTLEEHIRRTNLLETKMTHVEDEVTGLKGHVAKISALLSLLKPTKEKLKWLIVVASILGGSYGGVQLSSGENLNKTIEVIERAFK